jgi:hypothetical protein
LWKTRRSKSDFQIGRPSSLQKTHSGTCFQHATDLAVLGELDPPALHQAAAYLDEPAVEVDIAPVKPEELAEAHPGPQRAEQQREVARAARSRGAAPPPRR